MWIKVADDLLPWSIKGYVLKWKQNEWVDAWEETLLFEVVVTDPGYVSIFPDNWNRLEIVKVGPHSSTAPLG